VKKENLIVTCFWLALGVFVVSYSYRLGLGQIHTPGPGLFPFAVGGLFILLSLFKLLVALVKKVKDDEEQKTGVSALNVGKLCLVVASLFAYGILLEPLGYIITTFFIMAVLFFASGYKSWSKALGYSAIVVVATYFMFTYLGTRFPPGVLRYFGMY